MLGRIVPISMLLAVACAAGAMAGDALYTEDFSGTTTWEKAETDTYGALVEDGRYIVYATQGHSLLSFCQCGPFEAFHMQLTVQQLEGSADAKCLIALHAQDVYGTGMTAIEISEQTTRVTRQTGSGYEPLKTVSAGSTFETPRSVEVLATDGLLVVSIDGTQVLSMSGADYAPGDIGVGCASGAADGVRFAFDDILVSTADASSAGTPMRIDLGEDWPTSLVGVAATDVVVHGVSLGISLSELLDVLRDRSYTTELSGPLPQYVYEGIAYTVSESGFVQGIAIPGEDLPQTLRDAVEVWDLPVMQGYLGDACTPTNILGLVDTLHCPSGLMVTKMWDSVSVILSLTDEQLASIEAAQAAPEDVTLDYTLAADGSGDFATLEDALLAIPDGATLHVAAGTYELTEPVSFWQSVTIVGEGSKSTVISSSASGEGFLFGGSDADVVLEGCAFRHTGSRPADVVVVRSASLRADGCRFTGGVADAGDESPVLGAGLRTWGQCVAEIADCEAESNFVGFYIGGGLSTLSDGRCEENDGAGVFWDTEGVIRDTVCEGNNIGIVVNSGAPEIRDNTCSQNEQVGIFLGETCSAQVIGNALSDNAIAGLRCTGTSTPTAEENTCNRNGMAGILVDDAAKPRIEKNTCSQNEQAGIYLVGTCKPVVNANTCSGNAFGIACAEQSAATVEGNTCSSNETAGIVYMHTAGGVARNNTCKLNDVGIWVDEDCRVMLQNNTCTGNARAQIVDQR
jgi:parallel beta-helix repeat protein